MEITKNKLTQYEKDFFDKLRNYIDKPIYFYGSVQRDDYFPESSDIDIDIFSNNVNSTLILLENFLRDYNNNNNNNNNIKFKKIIYRMSKNDKVIFGYKGKYIDDVNKLRIEIAVYNEKNKDDILYEHRLKFYFPFYVTLLLIFLKILHYNLGMLPVDYFRSFKNFIIDNCYKKADFVKVDL